MRRGAITTSGLLALCLGVCAASTAAAGPTPRFTVTRTLPDGRTETIALTAEELAALSGAPRPAARPAPPAPAVAIASPKPAALLPAPAPKPPVERKTASTAAPIPAELLAAQAVIAAGPVRLSPVRSASPAARQDLPPAAARVALADVATAAAPPAARLPLKSQWAMLSREQLDALTHDRADPADLEALSPVIVEGAPPPTKRVVKRGRTQLGVRDGRRYGEQGRFYIYAGGKGGGLGFNIVDKGEGAGWGGDGMSYDRGGFAGQKSAGVGWRKGDVATSLGWVHEKTRVKGVWAAPSEKDDRLALTFSWRPSVR